MYDKGTTKGNNIDNSGFLKKIKYDVDKSELETKIHDTSGHVKKKDYSLKIRKIENKIPSSSGLTTNATLTSVENKKPDFSSLVKKTDYNTKISDYNQEKCITTLEFNRLIAEVFDATLARANLVTRQILMMNIKDKIKKLTQPKQNTCFWKSYFEENGTQNYLWFFSQCTDIWKRIKGVSSDSYIYLSTSKGLPDENIASSTLSDFKFNPQ